MKSGELIRQLAGAGFRVQVRHCRYFPELKDCMTRHEFVTNIPKFFHYAADVSNFQGYTEVVVTNRFTGEIHRGKHNFNKNQQFDRRLGVVAAIQRILGRNSDVRERLNSWTRLSSLPLPLPESVE